MSSVTASATAERPFLSLPVPGHDWAMTQPPPAPRSLPVLAGCAALALVAAILVPWAWLLLDALPAGAAPDQPPLGGMIVLVQGTATTLLVHLLAATWFATPWFERRGVVPAAAGLVLLAFWLAVDEVVADWRSHPWVQVVPEFLGLERYSALVANLGTAVLASVLLLVGAALLLTRPRQD